MTDDEIQTEIERLSEILRKGVTSWSHNNRSGSYDLVAIRKERDRLQARLNSGSGGRNIRVGRYNPSFRD